MQSVWYEVELGNAHLRQKNYQMAIKIFNHVVEHFHHYDQDYQFIHTYNLGYFHIGAYLQVI